MRRVRVPFSHIMDHPVPVTQVTVGFGGDPQIKADNAAAGRVVVTTRPEVGRALSRVLKNPFSPRQLKKVQMQGGMPEAERGALEVRRSEC